MERKRNKTHLCFCVYFFFFFIFSNFPIFSSAITGLGSKRCPIFAKAGIDFQKKGEDKRGEGMGCEGKREESEGWGRRFLGGPGSSPPRCSSKCGNCTPCRPVHVPVPPGTPVTAEYYPEAWRCKCGNKLFMP